MFPDALAARAVAQLADGAHIVPVYDGTSAGLRVIMEKGGIDHSVVLHIATNPRQQRAVNDFAIALHSEDLISFGSIHPGAPDALDEIDRIARAGLPGIKLHPEYQQFCIDSKEVYPLYERIFSHGLILLFHAGVDIGIAPPVHATPDRMARLLDDFPGGRIIAAHMGGYLYWDDCERYLVGRDIFMDTSYCNGRMSDDQLCRIIDHHGYHRILFGSDGPWNVAGEDAAYISRLGLHERATRAILGENAKKLLGLIPSCV